MGLIPGSGGSPWRGHGNPLQYSWLVNPMDREAWQVTVHTVPKSQTWLKQISMHTHMCVCVLIPQMCSTVCDPITEASRLLCPWNSPGKDMECVAIPFSTGSSWCRDWISISCIAGRFFTVWARETYKFI